MLIFLPLNEKLYFVFSTVCFSGKYLFAKYYDKNFWTIVYCKSESRDFT